VQSDVVNAADQAAAAEVTRNQGLGEWQWWRAGSGLQQPTQLLGHPLPRRQQSAGGTTGSAGLARALTIDAQQFLKYTVPLLVESGNQPIKLKATTYRSVP
jgi:hypothetical protein